MPEPDVCNPAYWLRRAAAVRVIASDADDLAMRIQLERLAEAYDDIARLATQLAEEVASE